MTSSQRPGALEVLGAAPGLIVSVPSSAFGEEPVTGASSMARCRGARRPRRRSRARLVRRDRGHVDAQRARVGRPCATPCSPSSTSRTWSPSTTMLMTMSLAAPATRRASRPTPAAVLGDPRLGGGARAVEDHQVHTVAGEVGRLARAHDPEADEADPVAWCAHRPDASPALAGDCDRAGAGLRCGSCRPQRPSALGGDPRPAAADRLHARLAAGGLGGAGRRDGIARNRQREMRRGACDRAPHRRRRADVSAFVTRTCVLRAAAQLRAAHERVRSRRRALSATVRVRVVNGQPRPVQRTGSPCPRRRAGRRAS